MWLTLLITTIVSLLIYKLFIKQNNFWRKNGVIQFHHSTFKENIDVFMGRKITPDLDEIVYKSLGENLKYCGIFQLGTPFFFPKDLEILKKILIKEFDHFQDRRLFAVSKGQPIVGKMLANLHGNEWKNVRTSLSPTFTTGKIRRMFENFNQVSDIWIAHFNGKIRDNGGKPIVINVNQETTNYTVDVIAAAVYGIKTETIQNPESTFSKMSRRLFALDFWTLLKFGVSVALPWIIELFNIKVIDDEALTFFETVLTKKLKERENGNEKRNDFLQLIIEARKGLLKEKNPEKLSTFEKDAMLSSYSGSNDGDGNRKNYLKDDLTAIAQLLGFFFAGFSTTSNFIGSVMYILALHQDVQDRLREEIQSKLFAEGKNEAEYETLNGLVYLDMVLCEVLRMFPALGRLERICVKDYHDDEYNFTIPKGTIVAVPVQAIHNDPKYYERPDKFYPEHFSPEQKAKRSPYAWTPFGAGARGCIGMRFALVESKAAIAYLVRNFRIEPSETTPIPHKMKPTGIALSVPDNLTLKLSPVK